ncbi:MAG: MBL fold metallo-hydrolase [Brevinema sp.]
MIFTHLNGMFGENCYIYANEETKDALVVDPGYEMDVIFEKLSPYNLTHIFVSHGHIDHIAGVEELKKAFPNALICGHELAKKTLPDIRENLSYRWEVPVISPPPDWTYNGKEGTLVACGQEWICYHTPGHAYDHTIFFNPKEKFLFGGDVMFAEGSFGRYDLPGSNFDHLKESLQLMLSLPDDTTVYAGHGLAFTIGESQIYFKGLL